MQAPLLHVFDPQDVHPTPPEPHDADVLPARQIPAMQQPLQEVTSQAHTASLQWSPAPHSPKARTAPPQPSLAPAGQSVAVRHALVPRSIGRGPHPAHMSEGVDGGVSPGASTVASTPTRRPRGARRLRHRERPAHGGVRHRVRRGGWIHRFRHHRTSRSSRPHTRTGRTPVRPRCIRAAAWAATQARRRQGTPPACMRRRGEDPSELHPPSSEIESRSVFFRMIRRDPRSR